MKEEKGSITVLLTLTFLLVLGVVGTLLEGARMTVGYSGAERNVTMAVDTVLTDYYRPLYDSYHVFFLEKGTAEDRTGSQQILEDFREALQANSSSMPIIGVEYEMVSVEINDCVTAVDYDGEPFMEEAMSYMKYAGGGDLVSQLLEKAGVLKKSESTTKVVTEKLKTEERLMELNDQVIRIIQDLEGLVYNHGQLSFQSRERIQTSRYFGKLFSPEGMSAQDVGVASALVYQSLKSSYINPVKRLDTMEQKIKNAMSLQKQIEELSKEDYSDKEGDSDEQKKANAANRKNQAEVLSSLGKQKKESLQAAEEIRDELAAIARGIIPCVEDAIAAFPELEKQKRGADQSVSNLQNILSQEKINIDADTYDSVQDDVSSIQDYLGKDASEKGSIGAILAMKPMCEANLNVLNTISGMDTRSLSGTEGDLVWVGSMKELWKGYYESEICFDYSTVTSPEGMENPIDGIKKFLQEGILALVCPTDLERSKKEIKNPDEYLKLYTKETETSEKQEEWSDSMQSLGDSEKTSKVTEDMGAYQESFSHAAGNLTNLLLFQQYLTTHFHSVLTEEKKEELPLDYGLEYLLCGEASDEENLTGTINRILLCRTMQNFITLLTDKDRKGEARVAAVSLVGYTGLEPLVLATQSLLLLVWAYEESLIDVCALLMGKSIPFQKTKKDLVLQFPELLLLNHAMIEEKATYFKDLSFGGFSYEDYMHMLLLMTPKIKKCYRAMDLIQSDMQKNHGETFRMDRCTYEFGVKISYRIPYRFFRLVTVGNDPGAGGISGNIEQFGSY